MYRRRESNPSGSGVKTGLGGRDGLNKTQGRRRIPLGSKRPRSAQGVSVRKQADAEGVPERDVGSKACRDASRG